MTDRQQNWKEFTKTLPSKNPYNHEFKCCNWFLQDISNSLLESGPIRFLYAVQGIGIVIAVITLLYDFVDRREERSVRRLTTVSIAYGTLRNVMKEVHSNITALCYDEKITDRARRGRMQMIALEELHAFSALDGGKYLAGLTACGIPFSLTRKNYYDSCKDQPDPTRLVLKDAYFEYAVLNRSRFTMADFTKANFENAELYNSGFHRSCLKEANFNYANLQYSSFFRANLIEAKFIESTLNSAWFFGANLSMSDFKGAKGMKKGQLENACICSENQKPRNLPVNVESPPVRRSCTGCSSD